MNGTPGDTGLPDEIATTLARLEQQRHEADRIRQAVSQLLIRGASRGNEVVVTVRGTGRVTDVSFDPAVLRRHGPQEVGALVTEAVNNAQERLARTTEERFAPLIAAADRLTRST
ncbi:YbaB/EbfC family nucleoid-associated protein [Plantactinospora sp. B5E13]|uniref:YbaB/EbfC family nucleoid-associated protein n=1 Tax=unclassified Plantactinospora TaxID=2631981 RepID=UPI00325D8BAB